jgi:hypothetical protein
MVAYNALEAFMILDGFVALFTSVVGGLRLMEDFAMVDEWFVERCPAVEERCFVEIIVPYSRPWIQAT